MKKEEDGEERSARNDAGLQELGDVISSQALS
jgi:hypothetical protein